MLHLGDIVQEVATGRQGKIDNIQSHGVLVQEPIPNMWRVHFSDGQQPLMQSFENADDLSLIKCPHADPEPGFVPERSIMEP
jgi:hypothetical protein